MKEIIKACYTLNAKQFRQYLMLSIFVLLLLCIFMQPISLAKRSWNACGGSQKSKKHMLYLCNILQLVAQQTSTIQLIDIKLFVLE
jgi:hypothetical protein